ncbi:MAG TPA: family 43 glycosylhydrolase [Steroidobacteraceae bacterium]|nr:family 43 glycosylhydrolase [Steroidobacteraceae bacterium]
MKTTRREALGVLIGATGVAATAAPAAAAAGPAAASADKVGGWGRGFEGQRKADRGDGTFLNPVVAGDHPDPSVLRVGADYYLTFSSFDAYPGLPLWHSPDLVNWRPVGNTLNKPVGSVWAPELVFHGGRFYNYFHARTADYRSLYVITAERIDGPWSDPVDLELPAHIDPGHAVGEDGRRWLFLSGGDRVALTDDGLATAGPVEHVYDPWRYPPEWDVETFAPEGPKVLRRGAWFYLILAVGGTAGPPMGHMVIVARSKSIHGPWENAPNNPIVRTTSANEKWWSRGHATAIDAPDGSWWLVYHGYEHGFWTLGRQTLLDPLHWNEAGWPEAKGGDLSTPIRKPVVESPAGGKAIVHGRPLSDDFSAPLKSQWAFYDPGANEAARIRFETARPGAGTRGALVLAGKGTQPRDASPLCFIAGDPGYEMTVALDVRGAAQAGVLLFYNRRLYCGLGVDAKRFTMHRYGLERPRAKPDGVGTTLFLRVRNDRHIVTFHHSADGRTWTKFDVQMEVSGYHHNVAGDFLSLRPALFCAGAGEAAFSRLEYRALPA